MRGFLFGGCLLFWALFARGQDSLVALHQLDAGFAPGGTGFQVTLDFSNMKLLAVAQLKPPLRDFPAPQVISEASRWYAVQGATARLDLCCLKWPAGLREITLAVARLQLSNPTSKPFQTTLSVAITPRGSKLRALAFERHAISSDGHLILVADTPSRGAILAESPFAPRPLSPQDSAHVESPKGECRGEVIYDLVLAPGQTQTLGLIAPVRLPKGDEPALDFYRGLAVDRLFAEAQKQGNVKDGNKP
jgi:hypothetical protein